jgi:hypothetical protein
MIRSFKDARTEQLLNGEVDRSQAENMKRRKSWLSTPTNIFRKRFATLKAKAGSRQKLAHGHIFGVCCGVHTTNETAAASISCRHRGILKTMGVTSAAPSTAVPILRARYRSRRRVGVGRNERE